MTNLLNDATARFEDGTVGDWVLTTGFDDYNALLNDTEFAYEGTHALKLDTSHGDNGLIEYPSYSFQMGSRSGLTTSWDITKTFPLDPAKSYSFSVQMFIPESTAASCTYTFGFEYFDADFVNQGAQTILSGTEDWVFEWRHLHVENFEISPSARYGALFVEGLSPYADPPFWLTRGRWYDDFLFEEYAPVTPPPSVSTPPSLRQRQNPFPVRTSGTGPGGGGGL